MRDWRAIKAAIGDRVFHFSVDAAHGPAILEAWIEEADQTRVLVRTAANPFGDVTGNAPGNPLAASAREHRHCQGARLV